MNQLMDQHGEDWGKLFSEFTRLRKPAGDAVLELALRNYIEMRDRTADPKFLLQKKIEARFAAKHPDKWIPLYSQVTFTHIPYDQALRNGDRQEAIMQRVMQMEDIENRWESEDVENLLLSLVARM
jgi:kynurenine 3-monooxygenase